MGDYLPSILDPPKRCEDCGGECEPTVEYVPSMAERMTVWRCLSCEALYYREVEGEVAFLGVPHRLRERFFW